LIGLVPGQTAVRALPPDGNASQLSRERVRNHDPLPLISQYRTIDALFFPRRLPVPLAISRCAWVSGMDVTPSSTLSESVPLRCAFRRIGVGQPRSQAPRRDPVPGKTAL